jgi:hypothetical protein
VVLVVSVLALSAVTSTVLLSDTTSAVLLGSVAVGWLEQEASRAPKARAGPANHKGRQESGFIVKKQGNEVGVAKLYVPPRHEVKLIGSSNVPRPSF